MIVDYADAVARGTQDARGVGTGGAGGGLSNVEQRLMLRYRGDASFPGRGARSGHAYRTEDPVMKIRAVVVDDEPLARKRLKRMLGAHNDVEVVGEAGDGDSAIETVMDLRPDLVFLDVRMPGKTGIEAVAQLQEQLPDAVRPLTVFTHRV